jgi:PAS domain S-box-containing protein
MKSESFKRGLWNVFVGERTIARDLTVSLVLIVIMVSMITIFASYLYLLRQEENRLKQLADEYILYLTDSLELPLWTLDHNSVIKIADSYFTNALVANLKISEKHQTSPGPFSEQELFFKTKSMEQDIVVASSDIRHEGRSIGHVEIGLTRKVYQDNLKQLLQSSFLTLLLIILSLILVTSFFLRLFMGKPFESLMQGIHQISMGNYDYRFPAAKQKEIKLIVSNFVNMAGQVRRRETTLAALNRQLEVEIRERKKSEAAIRSNEAQLRAIFESSAGGILVVDKNRRIINANDRFYKMLKLPEEFKNNHFESDLIDYLAGQMNNPGSFKEKTDEFYQNDSEILDEIFFRDGRVVERFSRPLKQAGAIIGRVWNFRDVTDRKRSVKALRESEERFRQLSDAALEAIIIHDNGIVLQVNEQFLKMFGYDRKEIIGKKKFLDVIAPEYREEINVKQMVNAFRFSEVEGSRKDGSRFPIVIRNREMAYYGKTVTVSVVRDISDRKAAEEETQSLREKLALTKKMEALGLLAGGVAHDLNNILSGIVSYPELLLMKPGLDEKTRKALKTIQESGERAAAVVNDLTTISRGFASTREPLNINSVIKEYLISPEYHKLRNYYPDVEIKTVLETEAFNVKGSRLHIRKSLMNLVINAAEAIETNGEIVIATSNCYLDKPLKGYSDVQIGEYALLSVADSGPGITKSEIERIFEPFYTRKVMGRSGTGLGLTVVWNTIQDHSGYINVISNEDGTRFDLYFPITRESIKDAVSLLPRDMFLGHGEKILVVDDEENQREIATQMLTALGYEAESVSSGAEALTYVGKKSVDLILLDMIMPTGMSGLEVYKRIAQQYPGQRAVIASGFSVTEDVAAARQAGAGEFLKKPYSLEKLGIGGSQGAVARELTAKFS